MSLDLSRALHSVVDAPGGAPLEVDLAPLARRIRRRRHVRAGVRAGVGVAAAGAVALVVPQLGGGSSRTAPAALPAPLVNAGPGECGSRIGLLPRPDPAEAALAAGFTEWASPMTLPPAGGSLGTYVGGYASLTAFERLSATSKAQALAAAADRARAQLAEAQSNLAAAQASAARLPVGDALGQDQLDGAQRAVTDAQAQVDLVDRAGQLGGLDVGLRQDVQVLVTRAGTVVASEREPVAVSAADEWLDGPSGLAGVRVEQSLVTCAEPGRPGGEPLPTGTYEVYLGYAKDPGGIPTKAAGPWTLTVERSAPATNLPAGFPPGLPLVAGKVDSARLQGDTWLVDVVTDATDRFEAAGLALTPVAVHDLTPTLMTPAGEAVAVDGHDLPVRLADGSRWTVTISAWKTDDGEDSLLYRVTKGYAEPGSGR